MNPPLIQLKNAALILFAALTLFGLSPTTQAQLPSPTPDGFYPGGNTAEGKNALFHVDVQTGRFNTAIGFEALFRNTTGFWNTATGAGALHENIDADYNTANGVNALWNNRTGDRNTATGVNALFRNTTGMRNTAIGTNTLTNNNADFNTAIGDQALFNNTIGVRNTAIGVNTLFSNSTGSFNTATGVNALLFNTTIDGESGSNNTANGYQALFFNKTGSFNTATGVEALYRNVGQPSEEFREEGSNNTATGYRALYSNTLGFGNTAVGFQALYHNSESASGGVMDEGVHNSAFGAGALFKNDLGRENTAIGEDALAANQNGIGDTAVGFGALQSLEFPVFGGIDTENIALGHQAGSMLKNGSRNIYIGSPGGEDEEDGRIRIGVEGTHDGTFIAGILGVEVTGDPVVVDGNGQLGVAPPGSPFSANQLLEQQRMVQELKARIALQEGQIKALTAALKNQADQIQKVNDIVELDKSAPQTVLNNH